MQIASSNIMYPILIIISLIDDRIELNIDDIQYILTKVSTICPAVILAANRKDSVTGRTIILVVSINTKNGFSHSGAPSGRKCAVDFFIEYLNDEIIILSHMGRPSDKVKIKCLDEENTYGTIPIKFSIIITKNNVYVTEDMPFKFIDVVRDS
jgi:hypothetical protein